MKEKTLAPSRSKACTRRRFMEITTGGAMAASASCARIQSAGRRTRPNVIYAFSDEHRWHSMAHAGMSGLCTPNMDRMASEGVAFTNCISNYPVCSPHRAILMTGRWPYQQGVIDNNIPLSADEFTLGDAFRNAGYTTGYVGKWHLGGRRAEPFGFDQSLIWGKTNRHWDTSEYYPADGEPVVPKGYNATLMTDQALEFVNANKDNPFFLMVSWNPPHSDFTDPPEEKRALYPKGSLAWRENVDLGTKAGEPPNKRIWNQNNWPYYQGYHGHVSAIDDELGRLLSALDELDLTEDTIIVYSSDHGSLLGSHGVGGKRQPYEESIKVPFLVRWPGVIPAGLEADALMGSIDIMPTMCSLAGLQKPLSCVGLYFSNTILGKEGPRPASQFIMHIAKENASHGVNHPAPLFRGVTTGRYTYAVYPDRPWCLFDNEQDPYQLHNLIDDPACASLEREMREMLEVWLVKAADPFSIPSG